MIEGQKKCSKCGEVKLLDEFRRNSSNKDGRAYWCRNCANEITRAWRNANSEKVRDQQRRWREANPEKAKENHKRWYADNAEKAKKDARRWVKDNPERHLENTRRWDASNTKKRRGYVRQKYKKKQAENYAHLVGMFGSACLDCGREYPMQIFDYHHLDPSTKTGTLSLTWVWERVKIYVEGKTVQLCPTCHRMRHFLEREKFQNTPGAAKCC